MWTRQIKVKKYQETNSRKSNEVIVWDKTKELVVNKQSLGDINFYPTQEKELVTGMLFDRYSITDLTSDSIKSFDTNIQVTAHDVTDKETILAPFEKTIKITPINVYHLTAYMQEKSFLFKDTSISESAALATDSSINYFAEDITRTTSIYKAMGQSLLEKNSIDDHILLTSGKIDIKMVKIAHKAGLSFIISRTAPTQSAYEYAETNNITLIGFARRLKCSIYTAGHRITD